MTLASCNVAPCGPNAVQPLPGVETPCGFNSSCTGEGGGGNLPDAPVKVELVVNANGGVSGGETVWAYAPLSTVTLKAALAGLRVYTEPDASDMTFGLYKNTTQIGTIEYAGGVLTVTFAADQTITNADVLRLVASVPATFAIASITIPAYRDLEFLQ